MRRIAFIFLSLYQILFASNLARSSGREPENYTLVLLYDGNRPICHGILIKSTVLSAAHCIARHQDLKVWYSSHGRPRIVLPLNLQIDQGRGKASPALDLTAIHLPGPLEADSDGQISLHADQVGEFSAHEFDFTLESKIIPGDISKEDAILRTNTTPLSYKRSSSQLLQFSQANPVAISRFTEGAGRPAAFSLALVKPMFLERKDLICQGQSGSPVFGTRNGIKSLVGLAVKGRQQDYLDHRWCSSTFFALRMDTSGMIWIAEHAR